MNKKTKSIDITLRAKNFSESGITYEYSLIMKKTRALTFSSPSYSVKLDITHDGSSVPELCESKNFFDMGQAIVYFDKLIENATTPKRLNRMLKIQ